jgi:ankyrin repeat protein
MPLQMYDTYKTIHEAVEFGCYSNVKKHIHGGTNVDEEDGVGATPLHYAVMHGFETIATLLLDGGSRIGRLYTVHAKMVTYRWRPI